MSEFSFKSTISEWFNFFILKSEFLGDFGINIADYIGDFTHLCLVGYT